MIEGKETELPDEGRTFLKPIVIDGREAGVIRLFEGKEGPQLERSGFISCLTRPVARAEFDQVLEWLTREDWKCLYSWDCELLPWYCPECDRLFSRDSWVTWDIFDEDGRHDSVHGKCPNGHSRMLED